MNAHVIALVVASAILHPLRDLVLKRIGDGFSAYAGVCLVWIALAAIETVAGHHSLLISVSALGVVLASAAGLTAYYVGTLLAMRSGELSVVYPIIRSSPVAIVVIAWLFLQATYGVRSIGAIILIVLAGFLLQRRPGQLIGQPRAIAAAMVAMLGSAIYSLADAHAMQSVSPAPFLFWVYLCVTVGIIVTARSLDRSSGNLVRGLMRMSRLAVLKILGAGVISYVSYRLILVAFQMGGDPAEVSAVRQVSIPVSILLAALVLGEPKWLPKLGWGALMAAGIAVLATK